MKHYLVVLFILISCIDTAFVPSANGRVWVCVGGSAYAYHSNSRCSGLKHCTHVITETSLDSAVKVYERKPCKTCCH